MQLRNLAVAALLPLLSTASMAQDGPWAVGVHVGSYHDAGNFQNFNPGLYLRYGPWTVGALHNSVDRDSRYVAYTLETKAPVHWVDTVALTVGIIDGYHDSAWVHNGIAPLVAPSISFKAYEKTRVRVALLPGVKVTTTLHLTLEWEL
jgi:hypothetical protein